MVYDEVPHCPGYEQLACPRSHTILVTQEPPTIKLYSPAYTSQFGYVLTTHDPTVLRHPGYRRSAGCFVWMNGHSIDENRRCIQYEKTQLISAICSAKQHTHTEHAKRYRTLSYLNDNIPGFVWRGIGINPIDKKYEALDSFRYHIAIENHVHPYHWSEKLTDALLCGCLPFYAGDPALERILPPQSFIRIPIDKPEEALHIIREAIANDEYTKRKEAIETARHLLLERYNLWQQCIDIAVNHEDTPSNEQENRRTQRLYSRRVLRRNPLNLLREGMDLARVRLFGKC